MSRPLRIDLVDGGYHVMSCGLEHRELFVDDRDRSHFLELLGECLARHGIHDDGRDIALWLGRQHCGMMLPEMASAVGAASAAAVGEAIRRMDRRRHADAKLRRCMRQLEDQLLLI